MCTESQVIMLEKTCKGTCEDKGAKVGNCHSKDFTEMSADELKERVKSLRMKAMEMATKLHDLAEEKLPDGWREIPEIAEQAYIAHRDYFEWKAKLDELKKSK